jgi:long-chain acyl-CoA synthetase
MNIAQLFDACATARPRTPALAWEVGTRDYGSLRDRVVRTSAMLASRGIGSGDRVALLLGNEPDFATALLAIHWRGAAAVVLSAAWPLAAVRQALAEADVRLVISTGGLLPDVIPGMDALFVDRATGAKSFEAAVTAAGRGDGGPELREATDLASVLYSSGTTGAPKGVMLSHGNLVFNARSKQRYCGLSENDRLALVVPASHCFGQNVVLLGALTCGAAVRSYRRFDASRLHADISSGEVTVLFAAPAAFRRLLDAGDPASLGRLRYALSAAAPLAPRLAEEWRRQTGRPLHQGYGLTECSPFATYADATSPADQGVGRAIDGVDIALRALSGEDAPPLAGEPGEILVRGPNVMLGYWRNALAASRVLRGGWLHTGDVGRVDEQGALHLMDRMEDVINVSGFKAYPSDVERALLAHAAVHDAGAFALPDPVRGARVAAAVVLREPPGEATDISALLRHCEAQLASYQRPVAITVVDELPRTASGKLRRAELLELTERALRSGPIHRGLT